MPQPVSPFPLPRAVVPRLHRQNSKGSGPRQARSQRLPRENPLASSPRSPAARGPGCFGPGSEAAPATGIGGLGYSLKYRGWPRPFRASSCVLVAFALFACAAQSPETAGPPMPTLDPNAVQNADGTFTNPDGSIVSATGQVVSPSPPAGTQPPAGASTPITAMPNATGSQDPLTAPTAPGEPDAAPMANCSGSEVLAPKRLVRLTFNQLRNSVESLFGATLADQIANEFELPSAYERTFPPLNNPREGSVIIDSQWQTGDSIAQRVGEYVFDRFAELTACPEPPSVECARDYANTFAEAAFRRPLDADELASFGQVFDSVLDEGGSVQQATQYSVYAALSAPQFLYRTEFGADAFVEGALTQHETASMLSYFITDGPPDAALLQAAAAGQLSTPEQLNEQVERLLQTPTARENLQSAMFSYFGISTLNTIVIDPEVAPQFTEGLRASMMRETELFINDVLWNGSIEDLLIGRHSFVNQGLAELYGVAYPPPDSTPDADGFARVTLPEQRSGILTQPGYLTTRSSPEEPSVVRRGLLVNASLLCAQNPPFPEAQAEAIDAVSETLADLSEREKAEFRANTRDCAGCHKLFDAYGLALDNFDVIGAFRQLDPEDRPIDASVTLPSAAGGATVENATQMANALAASGAFTSCVAKNLLSYALAEGSTITASSCATRAVTDGFSQSDKSFSALIRQVAQSRTFTQRTNGSAQ